MPMLIAIKNISQISYRAIMDLYEQDLLQTAKESYPALSAPEALMEAEQDFYAYLADVFFQTPEACLYVWQQDGKWVSCLRVEPYADGFLVCGLTSALAYRRKGYARGLLEAVVAQMHKPLYSHVEKSNFPSLALHEKCGFTRQLEYAQMLDGEVLHNFSTFCSRN